MNILDEYRKREKLTYSEVSRRVGLTTQSVFYHCKGKKKISAESAVTYHNALGIPLHDLRPDLWPAERPQ
ncbi:MAG: helix-turn-helix transcriptional regulator [Desulfovibrionaceae bacterium]|nr:helix-turn-helix transcriptional regulator [Desulfovibrionaceae bacterium]